MLGYWGVPPHVLPQRNVCARWTAGAPESSQARSQVPSTRRIDDNVQRACSAGVWLHPRAKAIRARVGSNVLSTMHQRCAKVFV